MSCPTNLKSITTGCPNRAFKSLTKILFAPPLDENGEAISFADFDSFTLTAIQAKVNESLQLDRLYPTPKFSKAVPTTADPTKEESQTDSMILGDGKTSFMAEIWEKEGADLATKDALDGMRNFNGFLVDKNGSVMVYLDETFTSISPVPLSDVYTTHKYSDIENTTGEKVIIEFTLDPTIDLNRVAVLTKDELGFNLNDINPLIQAGKLQSVYNTPTTTEVKVFISTERYRSPITGLTTSDVTGAIVGGAALTGLTVAPNTEKGAGYYILTYTAVATSSVLQFTWDKTGYIFTDLNEKVTPAVSS